MFEGGLGPGVGSVEEERMMLTLTETERRPSRDR